MSLTFHPLKILKREAIAEGAVAITLEIPDGLRKEYEFKPGQHVAVRATLAGKELRRTYSITDASPGGQLRLGIRIQGSLSRYLAEKIAVGETVDAMMPSGRFIRSDDSGSAPVTGGRSILMVAAGSGITPILSIVTSVLEREAQCRVLLIYGNQCYARSMFIEDILALKDRFMGRLAVHFLMSREPQELALYNGRLDAAKIREMAAALFDPSALDEVYLCGPGDMVNSVRDTLTALGTRAPIHFERFSGVATGSTGRVTGEVAGAVAGLAGPGTATLTGAATRLPTGVAMSSKADAVLVNVLKDGRRRIFTLTNREESVLEAAERAGLDLPYSCRSGVCSTCRVKVVKGSVHMAHNVALEDWELAAGFVLCCQARATSPELELSYDEK